MRILVIEDNITLFIFGALMLTATLTFASNNNFQFQIDDYHTHRQGGWTLNMYVRYALKDNLPYSKYPDYHELRKVASSYLEPSAALPEGTYWEI